MTARDFINMLETYMPDLNAPLECKGEPCQIWAAGGSEKVTLYIDRKEQS